MDRLKRWLADTDTTQSALAKAIGVSQPTVSDWLSGNTSPATAKLRALSAHTGLSIDELLGPPSVPSQSTSHAAA